MLKREISLLLQIQSIDKDNIHIYSNKTRKSHEQFSFWVVCVNKNYATLDKIAGIIVDYEFNNKTCVDWLFMSEEQSEHCYVPKPAFYC